MAKKIRNLPSGGAVTSGDYVVMERANVTYLGSLGNAAFSGNYATTATAAGTTVLTATSADTQYFTGATTQTVTMPVVSTLYLGKTYKIVNKSTGAITVNSSGSNLIATVPGGTELVFTVIAITGTTAASWAITIDRVGTATNDDATIGAVGQYKTIISGPTSLVTATEKTVATLSLEAGDWMVGGSVRYIGAAGTNVTAQIAGVTLVDNTIASYELCTTEQYGAAGLVLGASFVSSVTPVIRLSVASTTSVYLVAYATFSVNTLTGTGRLWARRLR